MKLKRLRVDVLQNFSPSEKEIACKNLGLDNVVRSINGASPDANGNITLSDGSGGGTVDLAGELTAFNTEMGA